MDTPDPCPPDLSGTYDTLDSYTPKDPILERIPNSVPKVKWDKCNQDLLDLHLFIFRLLAQTPQGHAWISSDEWDEEDILGSRYEAIGEGDARMEEEFAERCKFLKAEARDGTAIYVEDRKRKGLPAIDPEETVLESLQRTLRETPSEDKKELRRIEEWIGLYKQLQELEEEAKTSTGA